MKELKELFLTEHFTNNAERDICVKIREKRFRSVQEAATWANDRSLALGGSGSKPDSTSVHPLFPREDYHGAQ